MAGLRIIWASLLVAVAATAGARAPDRRIAVLEFRWEGQQNAALLGKLSDDARAAAVDVAKPRGYLVMTRENMLAILSDMGSSGACSEGSCEVETARAIGADLVVSGEVVPIGGRLFATLKLHESRDGSLLSTAELEAGDELELARKLRATAASLLEKVMGRPADPQHAFALPDPVAMPAAAVQELPAGPFPPAPTAPPPPGSPPLRSAALVVVAYDDAVRADGAGAPGPAIEAWTRLARLPDPNPYRRRAEERLDWWRKNEASVLAQEAASQAKDAACIAGSDSVLHVLPLEKVSTEDKVRMVREFAATTNARCFERLLPLLGPAERDLACRALPGEILAQVISVCSEDAPPRSRR